MKDNATHIRLIRDENGKPVEAEYDILSEAIIKEISLDELSEFDAWSMDNRIPVIGDWPDKEVYEVGEVEEVKQIYVGLITGWIDYDEAEDSQTVHDTRIALRLKAKQEDWKERKRELFDLGERLFEAKQKATTSEEAQQQSLHHALIIASRLSHENIGALITALRERLPTEQEAKTADQLYKEFCDKYNIHKAYRYSEVWEASDVIEFAKLVKQQYQQELIGKLTKLKYTANPSAYQESYNRGIDDAIEGIKNSQHFNLNI